MTLNFHRPIELDFRTSDIGELNSAHYEMGDGKIIIILAIYITPNRKVEDIRLIHRSLLTHLYTEAVYREVVQITKICH